jgi:hypothetical protein
MALVPVRRGRRRVYQSFLESFGKHARVFGFGHKAYQTLAFNPFYK